MERHGGPPSGDDRALPGDQGRRGRYFAGPTRRTGDRRPVWRPQRRRARGARGRADGRPEADGWSPRRSGAAAGVGTGRCPAEARSTRPPSRTGWPRPPATSHIPVSVASPWAAGWAGCAREHGLTCDNVVSFEVVTASGDVVRASAEENAELFWGLRGGGGNFGVVTEFEFRLHDTGTQALSVEFDFPAAKAAPAVARWRDLSATAPRRATYAATVARRRGHTRLRLGRRSGGRP